MDTRRLLACALAAELVAAGAVAAARLPRDAGPSTLVALPLDAPPARPAALPTPAPPSPTALPVPTPSVATPTLPPLPSVSLPPLPSVSIPPLPSVSLPPVPLCPEDVGSEPMPRRLATVDIRGLGGYPSAPVSGAGRIWFGVMHGKGAPHLAGVDPASGDRLTIPAPDGSHVLDVAGSRVWSLEGDTYAVAVHDARTGSFVRRYGREQLAHDGVALLALSAQGDAAGGGWVLAAPAEGDENFRAVVRVGADGSVAWTRRLDVHPHQGWSPGRGYHLAEHGGVAYVANSEPGTTRFWRVDGAGAVTATRAVPNGAPHFSSVLLAVNAAGLHALASEGETGTRFLALDPATLAVRASLPARGAFDLVAGGDFVLVTGEVCSFNLKRYDSASLRRTGFWRADRPSEGIQGTLHGGSLWMAYAPEAVPVALHRYDLP